MDQHHLKEYCPNSTSIDQLTIFWDYRNVGLLCQFYRTVKPMCLQNKIYFWESYFFLIDKRGPYWQVSFELWRFGSILIIFWNNEFMVLIVDLYWNYENENQFWWNFYSQFFGKQENVNIYSKKVVCIDKYSRKMKTMVKKWQFSETKKLWPKQCTDFLDF